MKRKRKIVKITAVLFLLLSACTVLSARVEELMRARVYAMKPGSGKVNGVYYEHTVPASCVEEENGESYVMEIYEREGIFGLERYVEKEMVTVLDRDAGKVAVEEELFSETSLAGYPSHRLKDQEKVEVMEDE